MSGEYAHAIEMNIGLYFNPGLAVLPVTLDIVSLGEALEVPLPIVLD